MHVNYEIIFQRFFLPKSDFLNKDRNPEKSFFGKQCGPMQLRNTYLQRLEQWISGSVANPGCLSRILDPNFSIPDPESRVKKIPDPGSGSAPKNFSIFNP
jgi:hypothetical protein